ncbi:MAG: hypothetical protein K0R93_707 [Anaerosolibacter sp.]|jgi:hypothetical protein|uniref:hypothetical protein n=1 Tax=Anaerosolibacter sp. TaxID=1872527 RepID=UPI002625EFCC|nr:hypothetical protein [Anaerosolibacter sp.]MDF2545809.1 hypothetical protein [Anaerosolibacter sp.]
MDYKQILEEQIERLQEAQQKCLTKGAIDLVAPISKQIFEITMALSNRKLLGS